MKKIYFLCTGNSCRSQIAEGYAKLLLKNQQVVTTSLMNDKVIIMEMLFVIQDLLAKLKENLS